MVYEHSIERSLQVMRDAMPWMTRQAAATHPVSYAVWYEYVSGENPSLAHAVDQHLARHETLDEAATRLFYERYIAEVDLRAAEGVGHRADHLLDGVANTAAAMNDQAQRYGQALGNAAKRLAGSPLQTDVRVLLQETQATESVLQQLQDRLQQSAREVEALRAEVQRVRRDALQDHLTGIANLRAFEQRLDASVTLADLSGLGTPLCLALVDIDHFKQVNDRHGHGFGDEVIIAVARLMARLAPPNALAARIGGEEFALLMPLTTMKDALVLAEMLRTTVRAEPMGSSPGPRAYVTVSVGLTCWRRADSPRDLRERADKALYGAKHAGRDCVIAKEV